MRPPGLTPWPDPKDLDLTDCVPQYSSFTFIHLKERERDGGVRECVRVGLA